MSRKIESIFQKWLMLGVVWLATVSFCTAQTLTYRIDWKGDSIGYFVAKRIQTGQTITYDLVSVAQFRILYKFNMESKYISYYTNGTLTSASTENYVNDNEKSSSDISYTNGQYKIRVDDAISWLNTPITESIATLYFNMPSSDQLFSERHGQYCKWAQVSSNKYMLEKPDNRKNYYYFKDGVCERVEVDLPMTSISFTKIETIQ